MILLIHSGRFQDPFLHVPGPVLWPMVGDHWNIVISYVEICTRYVSVVSGDHLGHLSWWYSNIPGPLHDVPRDIALYIYWLPNWKMCLNVYNVGHIIYRQDQFFNMNSTLMSILQLDLIIFRIGIYICAFCIKFQYEFNCDVHFAIGLIYYGNL